MMSPFLLIPFHTYHSYLSNFYHCHPFQGWLFTSECLHSVSQFDISVFKGDKELPSSWMILTQGTLK